MLNLSLSDTLVVNFFQASNYHYYMIYPPIFTQEYDKWWTLKDNGKDLSPGFTSLLLRALACSLQFLGESVRPRIERNFGDPQTLTERFHLAAKHVNDTMPPGHGGLFQVQQLLMTSWWFKSETRFVESWHALASAILAAQELGRHDTFCEDCVHHFKPFRCLVQSKKGVRHRLTR